MKNGTYISVKLTRQKAEKVRKLMGSATPEQAIEQMVDDMLYMEKMRSLMKRYKGKVHIRKVYE